MQVSVSKFGFLAYLISLSFTNVSSAQQAIDFNRDIAPIFSKNCVACHNAKKSEGGLNLETHEMLMQGGDTGDAIVAGQVDTSYLISRVAGDEDVMPPADNAVGAKRLTVQQLDLLKAWIVAGAGAGNADVKTSFDWQSLPEGLRPTYAIAASLDGQHLAFGRGNEVMVASQSFEETSKPIKLIDSQLGQPAAHLDIVQSIAFCPESNRIATGGYRNVKIWKRVTEAREILAGLAPASQNVETSPDGRYIAHSSRGNVLELVDLQTNQAVRF